MFTPKTNSKQKRAKKTQECETGSSVLCNSQLRVTLLATASSSQEATPARIQLATASAVRVVTVVSGKRAIFTPKPQF